MEQMHPGELHEIMDERMGGEGSESLRQVHINMGGVFYCGERGAMSSGMMSVMMDRGMMNNYYRNYNYNNSKILLSSIVLLSLIILILILIIYLWKKIMSSKSKRR